MEQIEGADSTRPHKTWFIERGDGFIFAAREQEAWELLRNRTNWMRKDFKILGVSDGLTYHKMLREGKTQVPVLQKEAADIQTEIGEYTTTENHIKYKELADDDDERLIKVRRIKKELLAKLNAKLAEIQEITTDLDKKAFNAELEIARGNVEMPTNQDVLTPGGRRDEILLNMPR